MAQTTTLFTGGKNEIFNELIKLPETEDFLKTGTEERTKSHNAPFIATNVKDAERLLAYYTAYRETTTYLIGNLTSYATKPLHIERRNADTNDVIFSADMTYAEIQAGFITYGDEFKFGKNNDVLFINGIQMPNSALKYFAREAVIKGVLPFNRNDVSMVFNKSFAKVLNVGTEDVCLNDSFSNDIIKRAGDVLASVYKKKYGTDKSDNKLKDKSFNHIVKDVYAEFGYEDMSDENEYKLMGKMGVQSVYMNNMETKNYPSLHEHALQDFSTKKKINKKYVTIKPSVTSYGAYVPCLDELTADECLSIAESDIFRQVYKISHERFNKLVAEIDVKSDANNVYLPGCQLTTDANVDGFYNATLKIYKNFPYIRDEGQNPLYLHLKITYINKDTWKFAENISPMLMLNDGVTASDLIKKHGDKNYLGLAYTIDVVTYMLKPNVNPSANCSIGIDVNMCDFNMVCSRQLKYAVDAYWYFKKFYEEHPNDMAFTKNPDLVEYLNAKDRKGFTVGLPTIGLRNINSENNTYDTLAHFWAYAYKLAIKERPDDAWYFGSSRVSRGLLIKLILLDDKYSKLHQKYDMEHPNADISFAYTEEAIAIKKERVPLMQNLERHTKRFMTLQFIRPAIKEGVKAIFMESLSIHDIPQTSSCKSVRSVVLENAKTKFGKSFINNVKGFKNNVLSIELKPTFNINEQFNAVKLFLETECKYDDCWNFISMQVKDNILEVTYELSEQGKINKRRVHVENVIKKMLHMDSLSEMMRDIAIQSRYSIPVFDVPPDFTSQRCSKCGIIHKDNRRGRHYNCSTCNFEINADENAAINIDYKGRYLLAIISTLKFKKATEKNEKSPE